MVQTESCDGTSHSVGLNVCGWCLEQIPYHSRTADNIGLGKVEHGFRPRACSREEKRNVRKPDGRLKQEQCLLNNVERLACLMIWLVAEAVFGLLSDRRH